MASLHRPCSSAARTGCPQCSSSTRSDGTWRATRRSNRPPSGRVATHRRGAAPRGLRPFRASQFLSHVWSTGQDQVAVVKRQLMRMMPNCRIFLDVDDLKDIHELETYVAQSSVVLFFLSSGYLSSRNCLREITAAAVGKKPAVLLLEEDAAHGGRSLEHQRAVCPAELKSFIFDGRTPIPWHRLPNEQCLSLKLVAEQMLLGCPAYRDLESLDLFVASELRWENLVFTEPLRLHASPHNPGAAAAIAALATLFPDGKLHVDESPWIVDVAGNLPEGSAAADAHSATGLVASTLAAFRASATGFASRSQGAAWFHHHRPDATKRAATVPQLQGRKTVAVLPEEADKLARQIIKLLDSDGSGKVSALEIDQELKRCRSA